VARQLWRDSLGSFRKYLNARWKQLGFASTRMAQRYAAAALVMTQVGEHYARARPMLCTSLARAVYAAP